MIQVSAIPYSSVSLSPLIPDSEVPKEIAAVTFLEGLFLVYLCGHHQTPFEKMYIWRLRIKRKCATKKYKKMKGYMFSYTCKFNQSPLNTAGQPVLEYLSSLQSYLPRNSVVFCLWRHSDSPSTESSMVDSVGTKSKNVYNETRIRTRIFHGLSVYDEGIE